MVDLTRAEHLQYLAVELETTKRLLKDALKCKLTALIQQRRQKIRNLHRELEALNHGKRGYRP
ncbi:MAG TPA: hypothetical protein VN688_02130 [Gemmataceae bacterium]|nr:hypothetical protein [Gemmataceae bacterium]